MDPIRVTVWNEYRHEKTEEAVAKGEAEEGFKAKEGQYRRTLLVGAHGARRSEG